MQKNDAKIANEFMEVVREIYRETEEDEDCIHNYYFHGSCSAAFSPRTFVERFTSEAPIFGDGGHHDCHEFIRALVDQLSDDLKDMTRCREFKRRLESENMSDEMSIRDQAESSWEKHLATNSSLVTDIFGGQLISTIRCEACGHEKHSFDPFMDLSLPFPKSEQNASDIRPRRRLSLLSMARRRESQGCSLQDCMVAYTDCEELIGGNSIYCDCCKRKQPSLKKLQVYSFPKCLVLHLKRFGNEQQKIGTSVEYPCSDLDVSALAYGDNTDAPRYDLYAVSDHHGSVNFGHYTSSCKLVTEEAFYSFNDEEVDEMVDLDGSKVYILFYKLRNK